MWQDRLPIACSGSLVVKLNARRGSGAQKEKKLRIKAIRLSHIPVWVSLSCVVFCWKNRMLGHSQQSCSSPLLLIVPIHHILSLICNALQASSVFRKAGGSHLLVVLTSRSGLFFGRLDSITFTTCDSSQFWRPGMAGYNSPLPV